MVVKGVLRPSKEKRDLTRIGLHTSSFGMKLQFLVRVWKKLKTRILSWQNFLCSGELVTGLQQNLDWDVNENERGKLTGASQRRTFRLLWQQLMWRVEAVMIISRRWRIFTRLFSDMVGFRWRERSSGSRNFLTKERRNVFGTDAD